MVAITLDAYACFKKLRRHGISENQAEIITDVISDICYTTTLENRVREAEDLDKKTMNIFYWIGVISIILLVFEIILMK